MAWAYWVAAVDDDAVETLRENDGDGCSNAGEPGVPDSEGV